VSEDRGSAQAKTPADHVTELRDMVVGYAKQETLEPLTVLGRYVAWGAGGSLLVGTGCAFLLLGLLRGLQTIHFFNEPGEPHGGTWSFVPYVITLLVALVMILIAAWRAKQAYERSVRQEHAR
jgi:hypothetical protein